MIIQSTPTTIQRGNMGDERVFSIKASATSFNILSSSIYSDKPLAVVRELACNAYDAHVAAGKADEPIIVHLPTSLDPTFYVKDNGTGLSHEDIIGLYSTYFSSSKTDSDDFIGALGLGSKSPFSYTSSFSVESRFNGKKSIYSCFKNESGMPSITLLGEVDTDENNGITVGMAVKQADIDKFHTAAKKALMYFNPQPDMAGLSSFRPYGLKHVLVGNSWKIRESDYYAYMNGPYVVQGFVPYPVDTHILQENDLSEVATHLLGTDIDLYVTIGSVDVAASREALSYDKRTIANLIEQIESAAADMRESFQRKLDECVTMWDLNFQYKSMRSNNGGLSSLFKAMHEETPFTWKGVDISDVFELNLSSIAKTTITYAHTKGKAKLDTRAKWEPTSIAKTFDLNVNSNAYVLIDTVLKGTNTAICHYLNSLPSVHRTEPRVIILRPTSKTDYDQAEIDKIVEMLGNPPIKLVTDLPRIAAKVTKSTYVKKDKSVKLVWSGFVNKKNSSYRYGRGSSEVNRVFSRLCWKQDVVDMNEGGVYVQVERFDIMHNQSTMNHFDMILAAAVRLGMLNTSTRIVGLTDKDIARINDTSKWTNLFDLIGTQFATLNATGALTDSLVVDRVQNRIRGYSTITSSFVNRWDHIEPTLAEGAFKQLMNRFVQMNKAASIDSDAVTTLMKLLNVNADHESRATAIYDDWHQTIQQYSMLKFVQWSDVYSTATDDIVKYINTVEATLGE